MTLVYWHEGHLGHVTNMIFTKYMFPLQIKFGFDWLNGLLKIIVIYMYISLESFFFFFKNINLLLIW